MKNWEKYEKEIRELTVSNFGLFNDKVVRCGSINCGECGFDKFKNGAASCIENLTNWLYQDDEIRVGDIVKHKNDDEVLVYVTLVNGNYFSGFGISLDHIGQTWWMCPMVAYTKTNKHIPLDKVIELIGGAN